MSKGAGKRKCEDESFPMEINNPNKRLKLEDVIFCDTPVDQETVDKPVKNTAARRRYKLLTAIHLKKKYKYYCKKHDVTYLIESVRKETKDLSKKSRDSFVQNFRKLSVSINFQNFKEDTVQCDSVKDIDLPNIDMKLVADNKDDHTVDDKLWDFNAAPLRRFSTNNHLAFDESDDSNFKEHSEDSWTLPVDMKIRLAAAAASFMDRANFSDVEEDELDDDSSSDCCESKRRKAKVVKCLTVTKLPGSNQVTFCETDDVIESGIEDDGCDGHADCDCSDHESMRRRFSNFEYESSSDHDDSFSEVSESE